jgi:hypothetical protein
MRPVLSIVMPALNEASGIDEPFELPHLPPRWLDGLVAGRPGGHRA